MPPYLYRLTDGRVEAVTPQQAQAALRHSDLWPWVGLAALLSEQTVVVGGIAYATSRRALCAPSVPMNR